MVFNGFQVKSPNCIQSYRTVYRSISDFDDNLIDYFVCIQKVYKYVLQIIKKII